MTENSLLLLLLVLPFAGAALLSLPCMGKCSFAVSICTVLATGVVGGYLVAGGAAQMQLPLGYPFSLKLDGFAGVHVLLICGLWLVSLLFARPYLKGDAHLRRYYGASLAVLGGTLGVFLSSNLFTCFIFFEILSFAAYLWVMHKGDEKSQKAAGLYLSVSVISGMVLLMGLFLLNAALGTLELAAIAAALGGADKSLLYTAGALILVGFGTKAGMYPFHIWLPDTYSAAPAPATALFSSILSKTGIYGVLVVSSTVFLHDSAWGLALVVLGLLTMLWGGICALWAQDMKRLVAYSSMSQIGFILLGTGMQGVLGAENALAIRGTVLHMLNHGVFKLVLFLLCGIVLMQLGTTALAKIKGYGRGQPLFAIAFCLGACGLGGVPLFSGYISKTLLHESIVEQVHLSAGLQATLFTVVEWGFLLAGGFTVAYMLKLGVVLFAKGGCANSKKAIPPLVMACALVPALLIPVLGALPQVLADPLMSLTQDMLGGRDPAHAVDYFSIVNLSGGAISLLLGGILYVLVVRGLLQKRQASIGKKDRGLLTIFYRPLLQTIVPKLLGAVCVFMDRYVLSTLLKSCLWVGGFFARLMADLTDWVARLLVRTVFRPAKVRDLGAKRIPIAYKMGTLLDKGAALARHPKARGSYATSIAKYEEQAAVRRRMIASSLSYGLLFAGLGLVVLLVYLIFS